MTDIVVLDTGVFLGILAGSDHEGQVYQKIIRRCDKVTIQDALITEYLSTLKSKFNGLNSYLIATRLHELSAHQKLLKPPSVDHILPDIDDEDRHVVSAAKCGRAKYLITTDQRHLWSKRDHIEKSHHVQVLRPIDYIQLPE